MIGGTKPISFLFKMNGFGQRGVWTTIRQNNILYVVGFIEKKENWNTRGLVFEN